MLKAREHQLQKMTTLAQRLALHERNLGESLPKAMIWEIVVARALLFKQLNPGDLVIFPLDRIYQVAGYEPATCVDVSAYSAMHYNNLSRGDRI